jgi:hypothetical protein
LLIGLVITLGMALSTAPLAFVAIAAAIRQGMLAKHRQLPGRMSVAALMACALRNDLVLQHRPLERRMVRVALAWGFLCHNRFTGDHSGGQPRR